MRRDKEGVELRNIGETIRSERRQGGKERGERRKK